MTGSIANVDMAAAWDGAEGAQWAEFEAHFDAGMARHHAHLLTATGIAASEAVLDVGCGCGRSTRDAARLAVAGRALGVDLSSAMLARARQRAEEEGLANVTFEQADAQVHPFPDAAFDVAMSRFGAMFFSDPVAAFTNIRRALRPGGRLALLTWRGLDDNEWLRAFRSALAAGRDLPVPPPGAPGPFGLADPDHVRRILTGAGFSDVGLDPVDEPLRFGTDLADAFGFVSRMGPVMGLLADLDPAARTGALEALQARLAAHATPEGVMFGSGAWLVTARR